LIDYEKEYGFKSIVAEIMKIAKARDKSSSTILNKLEEKLPVRKGLRVTFASSHTHTDSQASVKEWTMTVEFLIHRSLLDSSPTTVKREPARSCCLRY